MQGLQAGLEIWGPYYHCLLYWRGLRRGKECPLAPPALPTHPSTALTPPHTHSSHIPTIGLSIFLSPLFQFNFSRYLTSPLKEKVYMRPLLLYSKSGGNVLMSTKKGAKAFSCFDKHNVQKCKEESRCSDIAALQNPHDDPASNRPRREGTFFFSFPNPFSREGASPLAVRERSYTCTLAAVKTSRRC